MLDNIDIKNLANSGIFKELARRAPVDIQDYNTQYRFDCRHIVGDYILIDMDNGQDITTKEEMASALTEARNLLKQELINIFVEG